MSRNVYCEHACVDFLALNSTNFIYLENEPEEQYLEN